MYFDLAKLDLPKVNFTNVIKYIQAHKKENPTYKKGFKIIEESAEVKDVRLDDLKSMGFSDFRSLYAFANISPDQPLGSGKLIKEDPLSLCDVFTALIRKAEQAFSLYFIDTGEVFKEKNKHETLFGMKFPKRPEVKHQLKLQVLSDIEYYIKVTNISENDQWIISERLRPFLEYAKNDTDPEISSKASQVLNSLNLL